LHPQLITQRVPKGLVYGSDQQQPVVGGGPALPLNNEEANAGFSFINFSISIYWCTEARFYSSLHAISSNELSTLEPFRLETSNHSEIDSDFAQCSAS